VSSFSLGKHPLHLGQSPPSISNALPASL